MPTENDLDYRRYLTADGHEICARMIGATLDLIANKWAVPIILTLSLAQVQGRPMLRFSDLARAIPLITQKELTKQLRALEAAGLVGRRVHAAVPPKVEYWLTELGGSLRPVLDTLARWSAQKGPEVAARLERTAALAACAHDKAAHDKAAQGMAAMQADAAD